MVKKSLASGVGVAAALVMVFGSGSASGKPIEWLNGKTYAKAQELVPGMLKIAAREGSYLPTEECVIFGAQTSGNMYAVNLNCNAPSAFGGHPGNSLATPEGRKAYGYRKEAARLSADYEKANAAGKEPACGQSDGVRKYCFNICTFSGECSDELAQYLGL